MQALTGLEVNLAFRIYQALLGAATGGYEAQPHTMDMCCMRMVCL